MKNWENKNEYRKMKRKGDIDKLFTVTKEEKKITLIDIKKRRACMDWKKNGSKIKYVNRFKIA